MFELHGKNLFITFRHLKLNAEIFQFKFRKKCVDQKFKSRERKGTVNTCSTVKKLIQDAGCWSIFPILKLGLVTWLALSNKIQVSDYVPVYKPVLRDASCVSVFSQHLCPHCEQGIPRPALRLLWSRADSHQKCAFNLQLFCWAQGQGQKWPSKPWSSKAVP